MIECPHKDQTQCKLYSCEEGVYEISSLDLTCDYYKTGSWVDAEGYLQYGHCKLGYSPD